MNKQLSIFLTLFLCWTAHLSAQIDGDNIFENDQIITIDLAYAQVDFWDSLVLNYESGIYLKADLTLTDNTGTYTFEDVGIRLKGNSSYSHPGNKKSFKIDFNEYVSGQNYDGLKKLNFSNAFKDPTLMREKIFFDICRQVNVPAPRANFANVYFNGELWGFYTVIEQIDDQFLDWRILDDTGNLFKAGDNFGGGPGEEGSEADLVYYGDDPAEYYERYELKTNEDENDWGDLISLIEFINNTTGNDFEASLEDRLELDEYLFSAAIDNLFSNLDSYTESARNYYLYHNLTTDKWEWITWDGNESFGTYGGGPGAPEMTTLPLDYHADNRPLLENIFENPALNLRYQLAICELIDNYFNSVYMDEKIDQVKVLIQSDVYADGNKMYTNDNFDNNIENDIMLGGGPMGGVVHGLKSFVAEKHSFVSNVLDCSVLSHLDQLNPIEVSAFPNPFTSHINMDGDLNSFQSFSIFNTLGKQVYKESLTLWYGKAIDLSFLDHGSYFLKLLPRDDSSNQTVLKIVKL